MTEPIIRFQQVCKRTALNNVGYGLELNDVADRERLRIAGEWLTRLGLAGYEDAYPHALSGC